jgi:hypothetical protein
VWVGRDVDVNADWEERCMQGSALERGAGGKNLNASLVGFRWFFRVGGNAFYCSEIKHGVVKMV